MIATNSPSFTSILTLFNAQVSTSSVRNTFCKFSVLIILQNFILMILLLFYTFYRIYPTQYPTLQADNDRRDAPHHQQRPYKDTGRKQGTVRKLLQPMQHEPPADRHGHYIRHYSIDTERFVKQPDNLSPCCSMHLADTNFAYPLRVAYQAIPNNPKPVSNNPITA